MDLIEQFVDDNLVSKKNILKYIDDYSIYCFYIGAELELKTKYSSPIRKGDDDPSFSMYYSKYKKAENKILFKDSAVGIYGDVFKFVGALMSNGKPVSGREVLLQINSDLHLGLDGEDVGDFVPHLIKARPVRKPPTIIKITKHDYPTQEYLDYWNTLDIPLRTLARFYVSNPKIVHYISDQHKAMLMRTLTISYEILGKYKIYCPMENKKFKFRNSFPSHFVEGALQLEFKRNFAIITKSMKECIFFYEHFGWESVAGTSENTMIPVHFMNNILKKKYKKVFLWLDPDAPGKIAQERYMEMYPWLIPITFHDYIEEKDPTDLYLAGKRDGKELMVLQYLKKLIFKHLDKL